MCTSRYVSTKTREGGSAGITNDLGRVALHRLNRRKTSCRPTQASTARIARIVIVATGILALSVTASATRRRGQPPRGATTPTSGRVWSRRRPRQASTCSVDLIECRRWWFTQEPGRRAPPGRQSSSASARADSWCGDEEAGERCVGLSQCEATRHQAEGGYLQTTAVRPESEGVTVSAGIAPSLSATRWERTLSGVIRDTSRSLGRRSCAQSRIAAAASVAYPRPQCSRIKAQPSSSCAWLPAFARVDGVQPRVSKIMRPAWPTTRRCAEAVSRTKGPGVRRFSIRRCHPLS